MRNGFTLVELIIVIAISGIVVAMTAVFITGPIDAWQDQVRRAELVDSAEMALRRIARDVRRGVPNSVRITGGNTLELLSAADGGRYRTNSGPGVGAASKRLQFNQADQQFNIQGPFTPLAASTAHRLVIYNLGIPGGNAWTGDAVITPPGTAITIAPDTVAGEQAVTLNPGHQFALQSPRQRIFLTDTAVRYTCSGGNLLRSAGYLPPAAAPAGAIVTGNVSGCVFNYDPGTATRSALVTLRITLTLDGESISLLHQLHVDNAP